MTVSQQFVPVSVATTAVPSADKQTIEVELRRGAVVMKVTWSVAAASDFAVWTRGLLR